MTAVTVLRDRYVRGWPRHEHGERAYVLPLPSALDRDYSTDAHFAAYESPNGRRLVREALDLGMVVALTCVVFDIDCPETHGTSAPAPESWRRALREKVVSLAAVHPAPYFYETRGGARLLYRQAEPTSLSTQADAQEWSRVYAIAVAHLARRFEIVADPACNDWQRLYRLPRATRGNGIPENWPAWGDPNQIGTLLIEASWGDVERAQASSKAFLPRRESKPFSGTGDGLLFHLLRGRGAIVRPAPRGGWVCLCPARAEHTLLSDGQDATVCYPPGLGEAVGTINCLHAHCASRTVREWLRFFTPAELTRARQLAGGI